MAWTDETIETLKQLWEQGRSASKIAEELGEGISRNAVIGKAHRLGLKSRPSPVRGDGAGGKSAKAKTSGDKQEMIGLLDLSERMCKWPIGHPGETDFHFCGAQAAPNMPYCEAHCREAYQTQQNRRDRRPPKVNL